MSATRRLAALLEASRVETIADPARWPIADTLPWPRESMRRMADRAAVR